MVRQQNQIYQSLFLCIFLLISIKTYSQTLTIQAGPIFSKSNVFENKPGNSFQVGLTYYEIGAFSFRGNVAFINIRRSDRIQILKGFDMNDWVPLVSYESSTFHLNNYYLSFGHPLVFKLGITNRLDSNFELGPRLDYLLSNNIFKYEIIYSGTVWDRTIELERFVFGLNATYGLSYQINQFVIGGSTTRYFNLTNVHHSGGPNEYGLRDKIYTFNVFLEIPLHSEK